MFNHIISFFVVFFTINIYAQHDSLKVVKLEPIVLNVARIAEKDLLLPISISNLIIEDTQDSRQQLSFNEYLLGVPGLFALNAHNFSQDLRVSIRGFGARSAFGIRGLKIIVDGIPETTPDGQGQIDNLNLSIIKNIEVIRGPSSTLYGNASGGVISINTMDDFDENFTKIGLTFGGFNMHQFQIIAGLKVKQTNFIFQGSKTKTDGFRVQSGFENYNFNLRMLHQFSELSKLNIQLNYIDSPYAEDSGGLTIEEVNDDRQQARQRNLKFKTEEKIHQFKFGANFNQKWKNTTFNTYTFYSFRDFYGLLPFEFGGVVDLTRHYFGSGSSLTFLQNFDNSNNKLQIGYEFMMQSDNRERFRNLEGVSGDKTFGQIESFNSFGIFVLDHFIIGNAVIRAGIRYDNNSLKAQDKFFANGDDSGKISLNSLNPSIGLSYRLNTRNHIFSNFSTSFETPTLSELSSIPEVSGGFNTSLKAQEARNYELGYKFKNEKKHIEIALFYIETNDDLVPYELEDFPDRTFFRNAGSTNRKGVEIFYNQNMFKSVNIKASYTYSDFIYSRYETPSGNFNNNSLPGIPKHLASTSINYKNKTGLTLRIQSQFVGSLYTNDSNSVKDNSYTVINFNAGFKLNTKHAIFLPFLGINNIFDTKYNDNIRINAFGNRYYEPAPRFNIFGGVRIVL